MKNSKPKVDSKMELHQDLLWYGVILKDKSFTTISGEHRIRLFSMLGKIFYDYMCNGEVIECEELKNENMAL